MKIGIDIVKVSRIRQLLEKYGDKFLKRVYTEKEIEQCSKKGYFIESLAGRFAAKEAVLKALGTGKAIGIRWRDVEILDTGHKPPEVNLYGIPREKLGERHIEISISHEREFAIAVCIIF